MATLKDMMQSMSDSEVSARRRREYEHKAAPQSNAVSDALAEWMQGVKERTAHPLEALAKASQDFQDMSPVDQGMQLVGGGMAGTIGKIGKGAPKTKFDIAHEVAQRNASLPVSEGGLGLPVNNMPLDRAKAMGFDTPAYHGSPDDMESFKYPAFLSDNPNIAEIYANKHNNTYPAGMIRQGNIKPLLIRGKEINVDDADGMALDKLGELLGTDITNGLPSRVNKYGYDRATINNMYDLGGNQTQYVVPEGKNIRSRFAAFDPARRHEADILGNIDPQLLKILAGGSAVGLLGAGGYSALQDK